MKISERALGMTTSPIRRLGPYAEAAVKAGKKIYRLNIGQPDIATSPKFMEAIRNFDQKVVAYGNSQGDMNLIKAIQKYYDSWNMHYETKNIFVTNGGSEALELAVFSLCDPGDEILVFELRGRRHLCREPHRRLCLRERKREYQGSSGEEQGGIHRLYGFRDQDGDRRGKGEARILDHRAGGIHCQ